MKDWKNVEADVNRLMNKHYSKGRRGQKIDRIVIHHNAGNLSIEQCWQVWQTREASAHYQVDINGRVGQLVWDRDTAWHAANAGINRRSIGIEHANGEGRFGPVSEATLDNGAHLVAALCLKYDLGRPVWGRNVFGHKDFHATSCPGHLAGSQNRAYMARAQRWYDVMSGKVASVTSSTDAVTIVTPDAAGPRFSFAVFMAGVEAGRPSGNVRIVQEQLNLTQNAKAAIGRDLLEDGVWKDIDQQVFDHYRREGLKLKGDDATGAPGLWSVGQLMAWRHRPYKVVPK